jgi:hypothetical protein
MIHGRHRAVWIAAAVLVLIAAHAALLTLVSRRQLSFALLAGLVSVGVGKYAVWRWRQRRRPG